MVKISENKYLGIYSTNYQNNRIFKMINLTSKLHLAIQPAGTNPVIK